MTCGPATDHRNKKCVLTTKSLQTEAKGSGPCQGLDWPGGWSRLPPRPLRGRPRAAVSPSLQASLVLDKVHSPLLQFGSTCFAVTLFILWSVAGPQKSNSTPFTLFCKLDDHCRGSTCKDCRMQR